LPDERDELERLDDLALDPELRFELELRPLEPRPLELRPLELRLLELPPLDDRPRLPDPLWRAFFLAALSPSSPGSEWMSSNSEYSRFLS
jgi:hypothetical protein